MRSATVARAEPIFVSRTLRRNVFIAYGMDQAHVSPLVEALLAAHDHRATAFAADAEGDPRVQDRIERSVLESDAVVLALGAASIVSRAVQGKVGAFHATKPEAPVIPLVLTSVDLDRVVPGLAAFAPIDCTASMLTGFEELFARLGSAFLSKRALRNRRSSVERCRRTGAERRRATVQQRMQMGMLLQYCRATDRQAFDMRGVTLHDLTALAATLHDEAARYDFFDPRDDASVDAVEALDRAVIEIWRRLGEDGDHDVATVLRELADELCSRYTVHMVDRRNGDRRERGV